MPTNLLMISIDTLRLDQLSRWRERWPGPEPGPMPFLDGLIAEGVVLDDHMSCSNWTFHAATCTVAGSDPLSWGFVPTATAAGIGAPVPPRAFLADWLGEAGFHTILVTTNTLFSERHGNGTGYHTHRLTDDAGVTPALDAAAQGLELLEAARADGVERWMLHLHLIDPHRPYAPPEAYRGGWSPPPTPYDLDTA
ncbi:MAG TPA: hypothetical protein ENK18_26970, partial [Deltaproteobacteria bacterium]|nr:hypothetical protein [Deltaproteobacteria bacterium]